MRDSQPLHYHVDLSDTINHQYLIKLDIPQPDPRGQQFSLPAWIPGSYMIRDFARHITELEAVDNDGKAVNITKLDKQTWQLAPVSGPVRLIYRVYALDYSVRGAYLATDAAFFNGTSVFMQIRGQTTLPCRVTLDGAQQNDWHTATGLTQLNTDSHGMGDYQAQDYWQLIDSPVLVSDFERIDFNVDGCEFSIALVESLPFDQQRVITDLTAIIRHHFNLFGGDVPFDHYWFMTLMADDAFGGLEHLNSTLLMYPRDGVQAANTDTPSETYQRFLSLCSHELFHAWMVKRIKPACFHQPDLSRETYTSQLWIYEGITSYYDDLSLVRSGVISQADYLRILGELLTRLARNPGQFKQTVSESSFDAWTRFYQQDENARNAIVSYYAKGAIVALCLDVALRQHQKSLDELIQKMWQQYGTNGTDDDVIQKLCHSLGVDLDKLVWQLTQTTESMPLAETLHQVGLEIVQQAAGSLADKGGQIVKQPHRYDFGALVQGQSLGVKVTSVLQNSAAAQAGLMKNDVLICINHFQVSDKTLHSILQRSEGQQVEVHYLRRGKLHVRTMPLMPAPKDSVYLNITDQHKLDQWLDCQN